MFDRMSNMLNKMPLWVKHVRWLIRVIQQEMRIISNSHEDKIKDWIKQMLTDLSQGTKSFPSDQCNDDQRISLKAYIVQLIAWAKENILYVYHKKMNKM